MFEAESVKFLLWNLGRKPLATLVRAIVDSHDIDVVALIEPPSTRIQILSELNKDRPARLFFTEPFDLPAQSRFAVFWRLHETSVWPRKDAHRAAFWGLHWGDEDLLMVAVHGPSKSNQDDGYRRSFATNIRDEIRDEEERCHHRRTLVMGDFNINPFEEGMVSSNGYHATMTRHVARLRVRKVHRKELPIFYNPMWGLFGDTTPGPPGTFFNDSPGANAMYWNMLDQVLVRGELLEHYDISTVEILSSAGKVGLLNEHGRPDTKGASDHLPVVFALKRGASTS